MKRAACTIVSANYLHFAWTLAQSFLKFHPDDQFFLLLVDRLPEGFVSRDARVQLVEVDKLGLPEFRSLAFKFDLLELNTGVKPSFLKHILALGIEQVVYFDPDICIYKEVDPIYEALKFSSIVITPHILSPTAHQEHVYEKELLGTGVFNLGFVAVTNSGQGCDFLDWWEERCLRLGFQDLRDGLFVDQKWVDLAPCLFDKLHILRHAGCNVAYWNLGERSLSVNDGVYVVDRSWPLIFFHFSGYNPHRPDRLSGKLRVQVEVDGILEGLLVSYGQQLLSHGAETYRPLPYAYGRFSDGSLIPLLARRLFSVTTDLWANQDPFDADGQFFLRAKKMGVLSKEDQSGKYNARNLPKDDWRIRAINRLLFSLPRIIGGDRYTMLMKYLSYISILRHQRNLLAPTEPPSSG